jgi:hypothetical protein
MTEGMRYQLAHYDGGLPRHSEPRAKGTLTVTNSGRWESRFKGTRHGVDGDIASYAFQADDLDTGGCEVTIPREGRPNRRGSLRPDGRLSGRISR